MAAKSTGAALAVGGRPAEIRVLGAGAGIMINTVPGPPIWHLPATEHDGTRNVEAHFGGRGRGYRSESVEGPDVIAVDVGGTHMRCALMRSDGKISDFEKDYIPSVPNGATGDVVSAAL